MSKYHVALSYASEQRNYVSEVARILKKCNVRCFYAPNEGVTLWGKNLLNEFSEIFGKNTYFVVMFISKEYSEKFFPQKEKEFAFSGLEGKNYEYILPARFDDSEIPGLPSHVGYMDLRSFSPAEFSDMVIRKIADKGIFFDGDISNAPQIKLTKSPVKIGEVFLTVKDENMNPIPAADVCLIHPNKTHISAKSDGEGNVRFSPPAVKASVPYTLFAAHERFLSVVEHNISADINVEICMKNPPGRGGSAIFYHGMGHIKGINGGLSPILDSSNRTYLYASNISVNGGVQQPAHFQFGKNIGIEDNIGNIADINIRKIVQKCAVLDYIIHREILP